MAGESGDRTWSIPTYVPTILVIFLFEIISIQFFLNGAQYLMDLFYLLHLKEFVFFSKYLTYNQAGT